MKRLQNLAMQIFVFLCASTSALPISSFHGDAALLISMKAAMVDPHHLLDSWRPSNYTSHCSWTGVQCNYMGRVVALDLSWMGISGLFPSQVVNLPALRVLNVSQNILNGSLPSNISKLKNLEVLDVYDNNLSGVLPDLGYLVKLRHLDLAGNYFSGSIPREYGKLQNVEYLRLAGNRLIGRIPRELGNLGNLTMLYLGRYNNVFDGGIPPEIGNLSKLVHLDMADCGLTGAIPSELSGLKNLDTMFLFFNALTGSIPPQLGHLGRLKSLDLSENNLSGEIPMELSKLNELKLLQLFQNRLHGSIPSFIWDLPNLENLIIWENNFTALMPQHLGINGKLREVDLSYNKLTGSIPPNLCNGARLEYLYMQNNLFSGPIPDSLGTCNSLVEVSLGQNSLNGSIPAGLLYLPMLKSIYLQNNNLSGGIPEGISNVSTMLWWIDISNNRLSGSIPAGLLYLPMLQWIDLQNNNLSGSIPEGISNVSTMLDISNNRLSGSIPSSIGKLLALMFLVIDGNQLTGNVPPELGRLEKIEKIDLSRNRLSGMIPREIGNCISLTYIDISQNEFSGPIPLEIVRILDLNYLNVSRNHLNESIPRELQDMRSLTYPDFSYNNFSGRVLKGSRFSHLNASLFAGNLNLCGPQLGRCGSPHSSNLGFFLCLSALGLQLICSLVLAIGAIKFKAKTIKKVADGRSWNMTAFQNLEFGSDNVLECLKEENIIGRGGAGVVYRGLMPSGEQVAAKKLMATGSSNDRGFSAEIKTLGKIRHRHIVRLLAILSNHDTNLLVYEYMTNGSLGELLHGNNGRHLFWETRYKIAVEAAKGLCYLHHDCRPPILHRDVKSNNILLDCYFEAHVADFGLAKLLHHSSASESMSSVAMAGTFGYIAPEYAYTLKVDEKSDVYSFGVVLLELITGKRALNECEYEEGMNITGWVKKISNWKREDVLKITDPRLNSVPEEEAKHIFLVALLCIEEQPVHRPTMREIVDMLTYFKPSQ